MQLPNFARKCEIILQFAFKYKQKLKFVNRSPANGSAYTIKKKYGTNKRRINWIFKDFMEYGCLKAKVDFLIKLYI